MQRVREGRHARGPTNPIGNGVPKRRLLLHQPLRLLREREQPISELLLLLVGVLLMLLWVGGAA